MLCPRRYSSMDVHRQAQCNSIHSATALQVIHEPHQQEHEQCKLKSIFSVARKRLISFYNTNCVRFIGLIVSIVELAFSATHMMQK